MNESQIDLAFKAYSVGDATVKSALFQGALAAGKTILGNPGAFGKALATRTADSASRVFQGGKRYLSNLRPGAVNQGQRAADANLAAHQNFGGGMSSFGSNPLKTNLVKDKFNLSHATSNMTPAQMQGVFSRTGDVANLPKGFEAWATGMNPYQQQSLLRHMTTNPGNAAQAMRGYARDIYGSPLNKLDKAKADQVFERMYSRYGGAPVSEAAHKAELLGNRFGNILGPAAITIPAMVAPYTLSGWAGAAGASGEAADLAATSGRKAVADDLIQFEKMPMMERMRAMMNPQDALARMYQSGDNAATAHHYMFGAGRNQRLANPGAFDYVKHLAMPFFTENPLQRALQSGAVKGMQNVKNAPKPGLHPAFSGLLNYQHFNKAAMFSMLPKALGAFKTSGKLLTGTANAFRSLGTAKGTTGRLALSGGVGGVSNVAAGDENSNSLQRFAVGAAAGAGLGGLGSKYMRQGFKALNRNVSPTLRNLGTQSTNVYNSSMRNLAKKALPRSGNTPFMQNVYGSAYKLRRHPVLTGMAAYTPYGMYNSYNQGRDETLNAAQEAGASAGHATVANTMNTQGFMPRMIAALNPSMAAGALQNIDPETYAQYMTSKNDVRLN